MNKIILKADDPLWVLKMPKPRRVKMPLFNLEKTVVVPMMGIKERRFDLIARANDIAINNINKNEDFSSMWDKS